MSKSALVFPGQGSQSVGMMDALASDHPGVMERFAQASEVLGRNLWQLVNDGPADDLNQTTNTQPAMLVAGVATWDTWIAAGGETPAYLAGHSLGEYTALVCSGALSFSDAVALVAARGKFMQEAVPEGTGAMAAILGLDDDTVKSICDDAAQSQIAQAVNFNSPGQVVIAGDREAIERAIDLAKQAGAKRALPLPVSVPSHCSLMKPAAERLAEKLDSITLSMPEIPVLHNVSVDVAESKDDIKRLLTEQLYSPVRWVETVQRMAQHGVSRIVECGPGKVLSGLCKRIDRNLTTYPIIDTITLEKAIATD